MKVTAKADHYGQHRQEPGPTGVRLNRRVPLVGVAFVVSIFWVIDFACTCVAAV